MTNIIIPSLDLASRRCEASVLRSRALSKLAPEVEALLETFRRILLVLAADGRGPNFTEMVMAEIARIDAALEILKGE